MVLTVLYPSSTLPKQADLNIDIVAVHGLNGDPIKTWTHVETQAFWLRDFLPHDLMDARILNFGYNADVTFRNTTADIRDHARDLLSSLLDKREMDEEKRRPIVFIAHSLGGIIVKQALLLAHIEPQYQSIEKETIGTVFFGTPHRGSEKASYGKVLANIATTVLHKPSSKLIKALKSNSDELGRLTSDFRHQLSRYSVISFYEQKPMKLFSSLIVEKDSTLLNVDKEDQIPVNANHRDMCKFEARSDEPYEKLFKRIRRALEAHSARILGSGILISKSVNEHYDVPYHISPVFTGREDICQMLRDCCLPTVPHTTQKVQKRFVFYGMGGSGKTQICLKFAQDQRENFWGIFFIDASSANTADRGFLTIAQRSGLGEEVDIVKRWLANTEKPWLLILDNADDPSLDISRYFPTGGRGTVLITTRNPECTAHGTVGYEGIGGMAVDEAIRLLLRTSETQNVGESSRELAKSIVETLGCLALAIVHAGALIKKGLYRLENYCEAYSGNRQRLFGHLTNHALADYKYMVYTTWEISVEMIRKLLTQNANNSDEISSETAKNALELLNFFGFLHFDDISVEILEWAWKNRHLARNRKSVWTRSHQLRILSQDNAQYWDPIPTGEAIALLSSFSLIRLSHSNRRISLHPLVHTWIKDRLAQTERAECSMTAVLTLSMSVASVDHQYEQSLIPHITSCLQSACGNLLTEGDGSRERLYIVYELSTVYINSGLPKLAFGIISRALDLCKKLFAVDEEIYLKLEQELSRIYNDLGDYLKAVEHQEHVLQMRTRSNERDPEHLDILESMHYLGNIYNKLGRHREARELHKKVLNTRSKVLGDEHSDTLDSMRDLATTYYHLGQYQEALKLQEVNLQTRKKLFNREDRRTFTTMNELSLIYRKLGRYKESLQLHEEVMRLHQQVFGDEHPDTLTSMSNLASSFSDVGRTQEALELNEKVLVLCQEILGHEHPDTLNSMGNLASSFSDGGRTQEALELNEKVLVLRQEILGHEHPDTLNSMSNLALSFSDVGRTQEALEMKEKVLVLRQEILGHEHPDTLDSMSNLASSFSDVGRTQEALKMKEKVLILHQKILGHEHPDTLNSMNNLAVSYKDTNRIQEAIELLTKVVKTSKRVLGQEHPKTIKRIKNLDKWMNGPKLDMKRGAINSPDFENAGPEELDRRRGFRGWLRRYYISK